MSLDDLQKPSKLSQSNLDKKMSSNDHITPIVENINNLANDILFNGGDDEELLLSLHDFMDELKEVVDESTQQKLDEYCQKYNGFYRYARLWS